VLKSLELNYELLFEEARSINTSNASLKELDPSLYIDHLEERIRQIKEDLEDQPNDRS
jgi:hypothetical protein